MQTLRLAANPLPGLDDVPTSTGGAARGITTGHPRRAGERRLLVLRGHPGDGLSFIAAQVFVVIDLLISFVVADADMEGY